MKKIVVLSLLAIIFLSGCIGQPVETESEKAVKACIEKCQFALATGQDLSDGPCLSNEIISNWVCDVAHVPREAVDDQPVNQCSAFREGLAAHFVEVDLSCNFIRTY